MARNLLLVVCLMLAYFAPSSAFRFSPPRVQSATALGVLGKSKKSPSPPELPVVQEQKKGFGIPQLVQLISMGMGAPMLGEFEKIDEDGRAIFKLEANNLVDADGNSIQMRAKNFSEGYVPGSADSLNEPPGFFANLFSGGKLQSAWDAKNRVSK